MLLSFRSRSTGDAKKGEVMKSLLLEMPEQITGAGIPPAKRSSWYFALTGGN
jgi:hypothetical protein